MCHQSHQAFGTVHRLMLLSILKIECTEKFTGLIRSLHDSMKAYACVNGELLEPISSHPNVLVPTLFVIFFAIVDSWAFVIAIPVSISVTVQQENCLTSIVSLQWKKLLWLSFVIFFTLLTDFVMHMETKLQPLMHCVYTMHYEFGLTINLKKTLCYNQQQAGYIFHHRSMSRVKLRSCRYICLPE